MASKGVNKAMIIGNVGQDPKMGTFPSGDAYANFTIATSTYWVDKDKNKKEETEWHKIVAHGKLAEIIGQYVRKGQKIYIEGKIKTRKWPDKDGVDRYITEIIANEMQMLGGKENSEAKENPQQVQNNLFDDEIPF